jgi:hypothetical protein
MDHGSGRGTSGEVRGGSVSGSLIEFFTVPVGAFLFVGLPLMRWAIKEIRGDE